MVSSRERWLDDLQAGASCCSRNSDLHGSPSVLAVLAARLGGEGGRSRRGHFLRVVRGEDGYLGAVPGGQLAQAGLVVVACVRVGLQDGLEQPQAGWGARVCGVDFAVEEVGVSGGQEPLQAGSRAWLGE